MGVKGTSNEDADKKLEELKNAMLELTKQLILKIYYKKGEKRNGN